jgi:hypothetical protein
MIRAAKHTDQKAIEGLIRRQHATSKYAGRVDIAEKALSNLVLSLIGGQMQSSVGASLVTVAMRDGKVTGFIAGALQRIYQIGDKLEANDVFFVNEGAPADTFALVDRYLAWATGNRKVLDVRLSWTDAIPGAERIVGLLARKGLTKTGEVWSMSTDSAHIRALEAAA